MMHAAAATGLAAFAAAGAIAVARALGVPVAPPVNPPDPEMLADCAGVEDALAALVRVPTVSRFDATKEDGESFSRFRKVVLSTFPLVRDRLVPVDAGDRGLVFEWPGTDGSMPPVILTAHYDTVPPGPVEDWDHDPFGGELADGYIWGRGTQDVKVMVAASLAAAERLLAAGFVPRRTLYFAFGGDEETGGLRGAATIAAVLKERGVHASFILDEGGFVSSGLLPYADRPVAMVGVAEKGYVDVILNADGPGGNASTPPRHTAAGLVARAVAASESRPFPPRVTATLVAFLERMAPFVPFRYRLLFRNPVLTAPILKRLLSRTPLLDAMQRTTTAATMLYGSSGENMLPERAGAVLNIRILPGSSVAATMQRLGQLARRCGVRVEFAHHGRAVDPMAESSPEHAGYYAVERAINTVFPEAGVVPFMFMAGTDSKHYAQLADAVYRFVAVVQTPDDLARVHSTNERLSVVNVRRCCNFFRTLISDL